MTAVLLHNILSSQRCGSELIEQHADC